MIYWVIRVSVRAILIAILFGVMGSSTAAPPPKPTIANLFQEVEELASLMAEEQHAFLGERFGSYPICRQDEKPPECRTFVLFDIGNFMGNSATQYLALFDPVDLDSDYEDLPDIVKKNSVFKAWKFVSVIKIDSTGELYATFDGAKYIDNVLVLQGLTHGPKDPEAQYSKNIIIRVTMNDDAFSKIEIAR